MLSRRFRSTPDPIDIVVAWDVLAKVIQVSEFAVIDDLSADSTTDHAALVPSSVPARDPSVLKVKADNNNDLLILIFEPDAPCAFGKDTYCIVSAKVLILGIK